MGADTSAGTVKDRHERLLAMRAERKLLNDEEVEPAIEDVDNSSLVALLQEFVHLDRGRPRKLTPRTLLIGLYLSTQITGGKVILELVTDILFFRLSPQMRQRLTVPDYPDHDQGFEAAYAVVRRLFHAMRAAIDPSPLPANKRLSREEAQRLAADGDPELLAAREHRLALFTEFVLDASVRPLRGLMNELSDGSLAVDATPIRTFARGRKTNGPELSTDPDAGWYVREGDHRDPDTVPVAEAMRPAAKGKKGPKPKKGRRKKPLLKKRAKYLFGYDAAFAVTRDARHDGVLLEDNTPNPDVLPALVLGVALDKPGQRPAYNGLKILSRLRERGYKPGYLAGDLAYNNSEPNEWQLPVRALGYKPVYDYRVDQLGQQAGAHGAIMVEGTWYCPSMPQPLIDATKELCDERIDRENWLQRIEARKPYRLMPKEHEDADGYQRMMCPAEAGKAQCLIKPHTLGRGIHLPLVDPEPSPAGPLKVCRQGSVTLAPISGAKDWQALEYGDEEWQKVYFRLRNSVEGFNGYAKNPLGEGIEAADSRRIRGIAAQTILLAFQLAHVNRRKIKEWVETLALDGQRPRKRTHHRRRTKPLGRWTPTGYLAPTA
ncbi:hypothetical protein [Wenjunlia tyrosinilytica]|uniref:Transposase n=1 Tax=Wenjunlia tyrosinilytica TaxID=1544741 RepID=A0A917ZX22_9ACTN|nr:hypothetical protein [Wenjunlia tyrosinilytica]GGO98778.1 hypothetical protein GCM10012280_63710 [Wenjunlia tyrosinilytica]